MQFCWKIIAPFLINKYKIQIFGPQWKFDMIIFNWKSEIEQTKLNERKNGTVEYKEMI